MSTYLYLQCLDHDPPLAADDESGQHMYDLPRIRDEIARREEFVQQEQTWNWVNVHDYFTRNSVLFLRQHPKCRIGIVTEYNEQLPAVEDA
jgi:hypothetical protein